MVLLKNSGGLAFWRGATPLVALVPIQNALLMVGYGAGERQQRRAYVSSARVAFLPISGGTSVHVAIETRLIFET